jgi:hypothetical protein
VGPRGGQDLEAIHLRHPDVGDDEVELVLAEPRLGPGPIDRDDVVPGGAQDPAEAPAQRFFVVAEENLAHPLPFRIARGRAQGRLKFLTSPPI